MDVESSSAGTLHARGQGHRSSSEAPHLKSQGERGRAVTGSQLPEAPLAWAASTAKPSHGTRSLRPRAPPAWPASEGLDAEVPSSRQ